MAAAGFVGLIVLIALGGVAVKRGVDAVAGHAVEHEEATRVLERLARERPFTPPPNGAVSANQRRSFDVVTQRAWSEMRPWAGEMRALQERVGRTSETRPGIRDAIVAVRSTVGMTQSRLVLARALDAEGMSIAEYVWVGRTLAQKEPHALSRTGVDEGDARLVVNTASMWSRP